MEKIITEFDCAYIVFLLYFKTFLIITVNDLHIQLFSNIYILKIIKNN